MKTLELDWKTFSVSVPVFDQWLKANCPTYVGCCTDKNIRLHFVADDKDTENADSEKAAAQWDKIKSKTHAMAKVYVSDADRAEAIAKAKSALVTKNWDAMSPVERKLTMGLEVSNDELGL